MSGDPLTFKLPVSINIFLSYRKEGHEGCLKKKLKFLYLELESKKTIFPNINSTLFYRLFLTDSIIKKIWC